jgi:hypothetical protein
MFFEHSFSECFRKDFSLWKFHKVWFEKLTVKMAMMAPSKKPAKTSHQWCLWSVIRVNEQTMAHIRQRHCNHGTSRKVVLLGTLQCMNHCKQYKTAAINPFSTVLFFILCHVDRCWQRLQNKQLYNSHYHAMAPQTSMFPLQVIRGNEKGIRCLGL